MCIARCIARCTAPHHVQADELRRELLSERALSAGQYTELERQIGGLQRQLEESEQRVRVGEGIVGRLSTFLKKSDVAELGGDDGSFGGLGGGHSHSHSRVGHGSCHQHPSAHRADAGSWPALVSELR